MGKDYKKRLNTKEVAFMLLEATTALLHYHPPKFSVEELSDGTTELRIETINQTFTVLIREAT